MNPNGTDMDLREWLRQRGVLPWRSPEILLYEKRLARFFEREYQRRDLGACTLQDLGISTREGPMWEQTDALMMQHYDERETLFENFLDRRYMAYSMAYYGETPAQIRASKTNLEDAQAAKLELICARAGLRGDERVLNMGCGFGSLETYLLQRYPNIEVVGVTPSKVQVDFLHRRMQDPSDPLGSKEHSIRFRWTRWGWEATISQSRSGYWSRSRTCAQCLSA